METEIRTKKNKNQTVTIIPNSSKTCSCGQQIIYFVTYINDKHQQAKTPVVEIEEEIKMLDDTIKKVKIKINHYLNCPDWAKYHK